MQTGNNIIISNCVPEVYSDSGRGIEQIDYNNDGLPIAVYFTEGAVHLMSYDGLGRHLTTKCYEPVKSVVIGGGAGALKCSSSREYYGDGQIVENGSLAMSRFGDGYFDSDGSTFYYFSDYQGNNISVVDNKGNVCQSTDYYPYGEVWRLDNAPTLGTKNTFLYSDKEYLSMDGLHEYDFAARRQTPAVPGFNRIDPDCEKYYDINPYVFCAGNPVNAIDPSGKWTIFINGFHKGDGGSAEYWGGIDKKIMKIYNEKKERTEYIDGSMGGAVYLLATSFIMPSTKYQIDPGLINELYPSNLDSSVRQSKGLEAGKKYANKFTDGTIKLAEGEKIRFVTHSMGAAYCKGFIEGLKSVLGDNIIKSIEFELDIAPFQPQQQKAVKGVRTVVLQHKDDVIAGHKSMPGAEIQIVSHSHKINIFGAHSINSFIKEIWRVYYKLKGDL